MRSSKPSGLATFESQLRLRLWRCKTMELFKKSIDKEIFEGYEIELTGVCQGTDAAGSKKTFKAGAENLVAFITFTQIFDRKRIELSFNIDVVARGNSAKISRHGLIKEAKKCFKETLNRENLDEENLDEENLDEENLDEEELDEEDLDEEDLDEENLDEEELDEESLNGEELNGEVLNEEEFYD